MKLSIITINKDNALELEKTCQSVMCQTFDDFEWIVIDGASSDNSCEIIKKYSKKITYWISEPDTGVYNAMNKGIKKAQGEYCFFLNSGDLFADNNILKKIFDKNLQEDIIYGNIYLVEKNDKKRVYYPPDKWTFRTFLITTIPHQSAFIKKQLFLEISLYDETLKIVSDWAFFLTAIVIYNKTYIHLPYFISFYDKGGISSDADKCYLEKLAFLSKSPYIKLISQTLLELQKEYEQKNEKLLTILNSRDYRLGRILLYPLRKVKLFLKLLMRKK